MMMEGMLGLPVSFWTLDEDRLKEFIERVFAERFGDGTVTGIKIKKYPNDYTIYVKVADATQEVKNFGRDLGSRLLDSGLPVSVSVIGRSPVVSQRPSVHQATARATAS